MSQLENQLFQLKFTSKQLRKQSNRATSDARKERVKLKKALSERNEEFGRIYAANVIRKENEARNMLRLSSRVDAAAERVKTAVTMRSVTKNMRDVVGSMSKTMDNLSTEQISVIMDKFETNFDDLDVQTAYVEDKISGSTAATTPQDEIDALMQQVADEANIELQQDLGNKNVANTIADLSPGEKIREEDSNLADRLRALRPAT